jgi:hypothetical protein
MRWPRLNRIRMTAPAVVVLATVVNAAAPGAHVLPMAEFASAPQPACATDLGWAVQGGATHARQTRVAIARKAASDIRSMDLSSALTFPVPQQVQPQTLQVASADWTPLSILTNESTHQHSAP